MGSNINKPKLCLILPVLTTAILGCGNDSIIGIPNNEGIDNLLPDTGKNNSLNGNWQLYYDGDESLSSYSSLIIMIKTNLLTYLTTMTNQ